MIPASIPRFVLLICLTTLPLASWGAFAEEAACPSLTLSQIAGPIQEVVLMYFPDARFSFEGGVFYFEGELHDLDFLRNVENGFGHEGSRFAISQAGVKGEFSLEDIDPSVKEVKFSNSRFTSRPPVAGEPYFKQVEWVVPFPRSGRVFLGRVFYARGTVLAFINDLAALRNTFGPCGLPKVFEPIQEERAIELAKAFARQDVAANEVIRNDSKVLDHSVPGNWRSKREIIFRGGCCCACDGECDDIIVRMTSAGDLLGVNVKQWFCGREKLK